MLPDGDSEIWVPAGDGQRYVAGFGTFDSQNQRLEEDDMRTFKRYFFPLLLLFAGFISQCAVDPEDDILAPETNESSESYPIHSWLWAFDSKAAYCQVFHTVDLQKWASFSMDMHPMMRVFEAGLINANLNHSLWMAKGNQVFAFTNGILDHGDHGHIVLPIVHQTITLPEETNLVHHSRSYTGQKVAFADDAQQQVVIINVQDGAVTTIEHGSAHSAALLADDYLVTTAATSTDEKWAKLIYLATRQVDTKLEIGAGAHGDVYYQQANTVFIACSDGIYVIDMNLKQVKKNITYSVPGRTNFLYHTPGENFAVGLHKTESGNSDKFILLDLANETLDYITIPGAQLDWNISAGLFALAREGGVAVFADKVKPKIYTIELETRAVTTLDAPAAACPIAISYDGAHVWALAGQSVSRIYVPENQIKDTLAVPSGTDWIWVTSYKTGAELFDNETHEF
jgi:hypothetical protein